MGTESNHKKFFKDLVKWSKKKDSYSIDDFLKANGVTDRQLGAMTLGKDACYIAVGKAICKCLDNAHKAWKSEEISKEQFSKYLVQSRLSSGDVELFDRMKQECY